MSGWIKFDKDMTADPRLIEAATQLGRRYLIATRTPGGGCDLSAGDALRFARNALLGALVTLWEYADTHVRDDDSLPISSEALDALVGIEGFFDLMPRDWLVELDDGSLQLPGYCAKNDLIAKRKRAEDAKRRQAAYRARHKGSNAVHSRSVTHNAPVTKRVDLDQDLDHSGKKAPTDVPHGTFQAYEFIDGSMRPKYPKGTYMAAHWQAAERTLERLVTEQGEDPEAILAGVERYAKQQQAEGNIGSKFICNPDRFLTEKRYREEFPISTPEPMLDPRKREAAQREARDWLDLANKAAVCGFRGPAEGESMGAYRTLLERYMHDNRLRAAV